MAALFFVLIGLYDYLPWWRAVLVMEGGRGDRCDEKGRNIG